MSQEYEGETKFMRFINVRSTSGLSMREAAEQAEVCPVCYGHGGKWCCGYSGDWSDWERLHPDTEVSE